MLFPSGPSSFLSLMVMKPNVFIVMKPMAITSKLPRVTISPVTQSRQMINNVRKEKKETLKDVFLSPSCLKLLASAKGIEYTPLPVPDCTVLGGPDFSL